VKLPIPFCRIGCLALALSWAGPWASGQEAGFVPEAYPVERYQPLWQKSPFSLSTATEAGTVAGFAEDLVLSGVSEMGGKSYVWVLDTKTQKRRMLSSTPDAEGFALESLTSDADMSKVSAVIRKGEESAPVKYKLEIFQQAMPAAPAVAAQVPPPPTAAPNRPRPPKTVTRRIIVPSKPAR
jgi:hypothetical protein